MAKRASAAPRADDSSRRTRLWSTRAASPSRMSASLVLPGSRRRGHRRGRLQRAAAGEDGQAAKEGLLGFAEEIVTPGDGLAHGLLPLRGVAGATGQQRQALRQPCAQGRRGQDLDPRRGQLQGQGQPFDLAADRRDRDGVVRRQRKPRPDLGRPLDKQPHGGHAGQPGQRWRVRTLRRGQSEWFDRQLALPAQPQAGAAGGQHRQSWPGGKELRRRAAWPATGARSCRRPAADGVPPRPAPTILVAVVHRSRPRPAHARRRSPPAPDRVAAPAQPRPRRRQSLQPPRWRRPAPAGSCRPHPDR